MSTNYSIVAPSFTYFGATYNESNDFDFGVLSDYLLDDETVFKMDKNPLPINDRENNLKGSKPSRNNSSKIKGSNKTNHQSNKIGNDNNSSDNSDTAHNNNDNDNREDDNDDENDMSEDDFSDDQNGGNSKRKKKSTRTPSNCKDQIDRRRERNRVLARKTRLRKKFFYESLQRQVAQLAVENEMLKGIIKKKMNTELRSQLLADCTSAKLSAQSSQLLTQSTKEATVLLEKADYSLISAIQAAQRSFCITDPLISDNPIIFASQAFLDMTGYSREEVIGRNCRFLQGPETDIKRVSALRKGIEEGKDVSICLLNYKKDGTSFYNHVFVAALRDINNKVINFVGVQMEVNKDEQNAVVSVSSSNTPSVDSLKDSD